MKNPLSLPDGKKELAMVAEKERKGKLKFKFHIDRCEGGGKLKREKGERRCSRVTLLLFFISRNLF